MASTLTRGDIAMRLLRAAIAGEPFPSEVPDTSDTRKVWDDTRRDITNMPPGVVPDIPFDYNEMPDDAGKSVAADLVKVGPKGYIHGWIFVGAPGVGMRVYHPQHGHGTVSSHDGKHVSVSFDKGGSHSFEAREGHGEGKLTERAAHDASQADRLASGAVKPHELSSDELRAADQEFTRRAAALGKPDQVSRTHRAVRDTLGNRAVAAAGDANASAQIARRFPSAQTHEATAKDFDAATHAAMREDWKASYERSAAYHREQARAYSGGKGLEYMSDGELQELRERYASGDTRRVGPRMAQALDDENARREDAARVASLTPLERAQELGRKADVSGSYADHQAAAQAYRDAARRLERDGSGHEAMRPAVQGWDRHELAAARAMTRDDPMEGIDPYRNPEGAARAREELGRRNAEGQRAMNEHYKRDRWLHVNRDWSQAPDDEVAAEHQQMNEAISSRIKDYRSGAVHGLTDDDVIKQRAAMEKELKRRGMPVPERSERSLTDTELRHSVDRTGTARAEINRRKKADAPSEPKSRSKLPGLTAQGENDEKVSTPWGDLHPADVALSHPGWSLNGDQLRAARSELERRGATEDGRGKLHYTYRQVGKDLASHERTQAEFSKPGGLRDYWRARERAKELSDTADREGTSAAHEAAARANREALTLSYRHNPGSSLTHRAFNASIQVHEARAAQLRATEPKSLEQQRAEYRTAANLAPHVRQAKSPLSSPEQHERAANQHRRAAELATTDAQRAKHESAAAAFDKAAADKRAAVEQERKDVAERTRTAREATERLRTEGEARRKRTDTARGVLANPSRAGKLSRSAAQAAHDDISGALATQNPTGAQRERAEAALRALRARLDTAKGAAPDATKGASDLSDPNPVDAEHVMNQMRRNYPEKSIEWMKDAHWVGPVSIPLDQVDFDDQDGWAASHQPERVKHFVKKIRKGESHLHPVVAVREPDGDQYKIIDGHHRTLAYKKLNTPVKAYVGYVDSNSGPWDETHAFQFHNDADAGNKAVQPRVVKVGPKGYEHGWIFVGAEAGGAPGAPAESVVSDAEKDAVARYTVGGSCPRINNALRDGTPMSSEDRRDSGILDELIEREPPLSEEKTTYRGITSASKVFGPVGSKVGQSFSDKAFNSTSDHEAFAEAFRVSTLGSSDNALITVKSPRGTKLLDVGQRKFYYSDSALYIGSGEQLVPRNAVYHLASDEMKPGGAGGDIRHITLVRQT